MQVLCNIEECTGCGACFAICPQKAIKMEEDEEGFLYPQIEQDMCIECGLCTSTCPILNNRKIEDECNYAVAFQHKDSEIREKSTSGGFFTAVSDYVLKENGVIYGVIYNKDFVAEHIRAEDKMNRNKMLGSKYVQSRMFEIYKIILDDLRREKLVLFTGTPCQIDGLLHYLNINKCNISSLITCALVCHGVPSPMIWKQHIEYLEKKYNKKLVSYTHRPKIKGWHGHNEMAEFEDGKKVWKTKASQNFKDLFYGHYIMRPVCHKCIYTSQLCGCDITFGDFWGCEDLFPERDDNKGTSIVIVHSYKGQKLLNSISRQGNMWEVKSSDALKFNHNKPSPMNENRMQFWEDYQIHGYTYVVKKYSQDNLLGKLKYYNKNFLRGLLQRIGILHV